MKIARVLSCGAEDCTYRKHGFRCEAKGVYVQANGVCSEYAKGKHDDVDDGKTCDAAPGELGRDLCGPEPGNDIPVDIAEVEADEDY